MIDKIQSLYQGRPAQLREADCSVPMTFLDEYDELEQFTSVSYTDHQHQLGLPLYTISVFREFCRLSIIMDRILSCLYSERCSRQNPDDLFQESRTIHRDLEHWRKSLPSHLKFNHSAPASSHLLPHALSLLYVSSLMTNALYTITNIYLPPQSAL